MNKQLAVVSFALLLCCTLVPAMAGAADESIAGKWKVVAETPAGPRQLEFEFKQDGANLAGTASVSEAGGSFRTVKFEHPNFSADLEIGGGAYRLQGTLKEGKLSGSWEQISGDLKGTWTAVRTSPTAASTAPAPAAGIAGAWATLAVTPNGDLATTLELREEGEKVSGEIRSDMGSLPIQSGSFRDNKLQFDLDLGGTMYRIQAALKEGKFVGSWAPAAGGEGGAWSATRKDAPSVTAAPAAAKPAIPAVVGLWNTVASGPDGELRFVVEIKQNGENLSGTIQTPDGTVAIQKAAFANDKLSFEVDYMGGTYRIEATLANEKLTGKWSAVGGTDTGNLTAERKK